jgi:FMN phosphatase YigB (HAD superfamily)
VTAAAQHPSAAIAAGAIAPGPITAVAFDLDGTLYDLGLARGPILWRTFPRWRTLRVGRAVRETLRGQRFASGDALLAAEAAEVACRLGRDVDQTRQQLAQVFDHDVVRALRGVGARPGTRAALEALARAGLKLAVISDRGAVSAKLTALGLGDLPWGALVCADAVGVLKPDPLLFVTAAAQLGVAPAAMLHVGDRDDADAAGARAAGCPFLLLGAPPLAQLGQLPGLLAVAGASSAGAPAG